MTKKNAFYAQSGGVTAVINASGCGVIETCRKHSDKIGNVLVAQGDVSVPGTWGSTSGGTLRFTNDAAWSGAGENFGNVLINNGTITVRLTDAGVSDGLIIADCVKFTIHEPAPAPPGRAPSTGDRRAPAGPGRRAPPAGSARSAPR